MPSLQFVISDRMSLILPLNSNDRSIPLNVYKFGLWKWFQGIEYHQPMYPGGPLRQIELSQRLAELIGWRSRLLGICLKIRAQGLCNLRNRHCMSALISSWHTGNDDMLVFNPWPWQYHHSTVLPLNSSINSLHASAQDGKLSNFYAIYQQFW